MRDMTPFPGTPGAARVKPAPLKGLSAHPGYGLAAHPLGARHIAIGLSLIAGVKSSDGSYISNLLLLIASPLDKKPREGNAPRGPKTGTGDLTWPL